jgi:hypothetical protein
VEGCGLYFTRQTAYKPLSAELNWSDGHWFTSFNQSVPCPPVMSKQDFGTEHSDWVIAVTPSAIHGIEHTEVRRNAHCNEAESIDDWTASPVQEPGV